jgi:1,4-dihydroxy-2-naphthoate octaprenyltransferase
VISDFFEEIGELKMTNTSNIERSRLSIWIQAARPFAVTATVAPVLIGIMSALAFFDGKADWFLIPFVLFGAILLHTGGNFISEYFDYKHNVDRQDTYGSSRVIIEGLLTPDEVKKASIVVFALGVLLGSVAIFVRGDLTILWIGLIGLFCGVMYGAKPFELKYRALGDLAIFLAFGPTMVFGTYYALTGDFNLVPVWASLPISLLVIAILHANNTRDIKHDGEAHIKTMAMLLGIKGAKAYYYMLTFGSYVILGVLVALKIIPIWTLLALLSLPPAIANAKVMAKAEIDKPEIIAELDGMTAKQHLLFGVTMSVGLLISALVPWG